MNVTLKIKNEDNEIKKVQHEIEKINLFQLTKSIEVIKDVIKLAEEDQHLKELLIEVFDHTGEEEITNEDGTKILQKAGGAFEVLMVNVPQKAFELLSILSGIEYNILMQQKIEEVFEIYDGVIEVNDIKKLVERGKKSFTLTKKQAKIFKRKKKETTEQTQQ